MTLNSTTDNLGRRKKRSESVANLVPVDAAYFYPDMHINFSVYIRMGKTTTLLCSNVTLTDALIEKIDTAEDAGHLICVSPGSYKKIIENAAKIAEKNGNNIDWNDVQKIAEHPPTVEAVLRQRGLMMNPVAEDKEEKLLTDQDKAEKKASMKEDKPSVFLVNEAKEKISPEKMKEIEMTVQRIGEYSDLTESIQKIYDRAAKDIPVDTDMLNSAAEKIVNMVKTSDTAIIMQCISSIQNEQRYLVTHAQNVACINVIIGAWLFRNRTELVNLALTGLLCNIGMTSIPDAILMKPVKLLADEYEQVKNHIEYSYDFAVSAGITNPDILLGIKHHHERINGTGYPDGLKTDGISSLAKITAISDMFDAMTTERTYKEFRSPLDAMEEFSKLRFSELDMKIVNTVLDNLTRIFMNKQVLLTNNKTGRIVSLNSSDFSHPIVLVENEYFKTTNYVKVKSISNFIPIKD